MRRRANKFAFYERNGEERTVKDLYTKLIATYGPGKAEFAGVRTPDVAKTPPAAVPEEEQTRIEPVAAPLRLASHFQNIRPDPQGATLGRPFQSLFTTAEVQPLAKPEQPKSGGPLMLIPESVRLATAQTQQAPPSVKDGAILARPDGGPLNIIPRAPIGLAAKACTDAQPVPHPQRRRVVDGCCWWIAPTHCIR